MVNSERTCLDCLFEGREFAANDLDAWLDDLALGSCDEVTTAGILASWSARGETPAEIAAVVEHFRRRMLRIARVPSGAFDNCGTGGDRSGSFNISTASALVIAAAGIPVVKHGSRAMSGRSGSMDVLAQLRLPLALVPAQAEELLERFGIAFCPAPAYHPTLVPLGDLRRRLAQRTVFNFTGPLLNPAGVPYQVIGVGRLSWLDPLAEAVRQLGTQRTVLIHAEIGMDECSPHGTNHLRIVEGPTLQRQTIPGESLGLPSVDWNEVRADDSASSAAIIRGVWANQPGSARTLVQANAGLGLWATNRADSFPEGIALAKQLLDSGAVLHLYQELLQFA